MRIADNMNYGQVNRNISKNRAEASDLQNQAASQRRVNKPSDDAVATTKALATRTELVGIDQFMRNINNAKTFLDYTEQTLGELSELLTRAKELAIQQSSSGSATIGTRQAVAAEVNQIFRGAVQIGNRKIGDRYIFGGYKTLQTPFNANGEYLGDTGQIMVEISKGSFVPMNLPGNVVFMGDKLNSRALTDDNGEIPQTLSQLGASLRKSNEEPGPTREKMPAGLSLDPKNLDVKMRGPASVSEPGQVEENSGNVEVRGENLFGVLQDLEISLRTNDPKAIQDTLERIDKTLEQVVMARSQVGTRQSATQAQLDSLQRYSVDSKAHLSQLEDADVYQVYSDLTKNENTLKATMTSGGKLVQMSLLDFLR